MTRRDLGKVALFQAAVAKAQTAKKYTGALDGVETKVDANDFDPVLYTNKLYDSAPLRMTFQAKTRRGGRVAEAPARQDRRTGRRFPRETRAARAADARGPRLPAYRREKFVFQSRPGVSVLGYLLTPKSGNAPHPAVVCVPGHGRGVDDIVGIDEKGQRPHRQGRLSVRFRHPGGGARNGRGGDRADGVRLPPRSA